MNPKLKEFKKITEELATLYVAKNEEYGDSFGEMYKEDGLTPCLYQLKHKINRAIQVANKESVEFESLDDTLRDLANYAIMTYMEYRIDKKAKKPKEPNMYNEAVDNIKCKLVEIIKDLIDETDNQDEAELLYRAFTPVMNSETFQELFDAVYTSIECIENEIDIDALLPDEKELLNAFKESLPLEGLILEMLYSGVKQND